MVNSETWVQAQPNFMFSALKFGSRLFGCTHTTPQKQSSIYTMFELQGASFDWFVGLIFLLGWIQDESLLNPLPTNCVQKPHEIFCGPFC